MGKDLRIPVHFEQTAQVYEYDRNRYSNSRKRYIPQPRATPNPQTIEFCERLGIKDPLCSLLESINVSNYEDSPCSTPEKINSTTFLSFNESFEGMNNDVDNTNQSSLSNSLISDYTSTPNCATKKRKFSFPSFKEPNVDSPSGSSSFSSFKEPNYDSFPTDMSFPSFKEPNEDNSSADVLPFQIDRAGKY